jgi:ankyrin repeat protein
MVKNFRFAILMGAACAVLSAPAAAQLGPGYESLEFVDAVKKRDGDKATELLNSKPASVLVNARDGDGNTALIIAVARKDPEWTGFLLNKGADPNLTGKGGDTPLIVAARYGFEDAVEWLLSLGAKIDGANKMGETALITAVQQRQTPIVRLLLNAGANPDRTDTAAGYSARDYAQRDGRSRDILQLIQAKKPKPDAVH